MDFNSYYFEDIYFEDINTNDGFIASIKKEDSIYNKLLPFILKGKADSMTELSIDELTIPTVEYANIKNRTFRMTANTIFQQKQDRKIICYQGSVQIDRVCIDNINPMNVVQCGEQTVIRKCDLVLQYQTGVFGIYDRGE